MRDRVMDKFCRSEESSPFPRVVGAEDPEIGFNLLIGPFGLPVSLGMVSREEVNVVFKDASKFTSKGRGKLRASVGDDGVV